ncbi:MAG: non-canonical purine NTP pyrophosphatase [Rhodobacter sp.]|nr:non-canonical purine NTP pyrophosphatase [Rhodobacter sp.]MCA3457221.1 non-canonical purine NTP pyrophosphatase [Rhodobacter sp.]MCA3460243.1 non-canonical purine NTP pyrophosphatase [Rhodobacter sp.]MCA3463369.1 non-canonical purine NTP pyrophosphatase [Rhodobacter sp.]MCA3466614.1 non-canonical purine NTP pyrophosphatase [Rhodobacter sp.]
MRKFTEPRLVLASHNAGKREEIERLLQPFGVDVVSVAALGLPEPAETEDSFIGNARIKAHTAARASGTPALADDSGIEVEALGGAPGVYTADWAETPQGRDFGMAMRRTWEAVDAAGADQPWRARFCCTLALAWPDGEDIIFQGFVDGILVWPPRGTQGHGYDPMFQPDGHSLTFGEMNRWEKNLISHRADAFRKLVAGCFT